MNVRSLAAATAVAGLLSVGIAHPAWAQDAVVAAAGSPVKIVHCFVTSPKPLSRLAGGTEIAYVNEGPTILHTVTFEVGYQNAAGPLLRTVQDIGRFAPYTQIKHHFVLFSDVLYGGKPTTSCRVISAV